MYKHDTWDEIVGMSDNALHSYYRGLTPHKYSCQVYTFYIMSICNFKISVKEHGTYESQ